MCYHERMRSAAGGRGGCGCAARKPGRAASAGRCGCRGSITRAAATRKGASRVVAAPRSGGVPTAAAASLRGTTPPRLYLTHEEGVGTFSVPPGVARPSVRRISPPSLCEGEGECPIEGRYCGNPDLVPVGHPGLIDSRSEFFDGPANFVGDIGQRERDLLTMALSILWHNEDLVAWAHCLLTAHPARGRCLKRRVRGRKIQYRIEVSDRFGISKKYGCRPDGGDFVMWTPGTTKIWVCRTAKKVEEARIYWRDHKSPMDRNCIALYIAGFLLHEISHMCHRAAGLRHDSRHPRACDFPERVRAIFVWAVAQRLNALGALSDDCLGLLDASWFCLRTDRSNFVVR